MISMTNLSVKGFLKIFDPVSMEVFVEKTNAIHYENMSESIANMLGNKSTGLI